LLLANVSICLCRGRRWKFSVLYKGPSVPSRGIASVDRVRILSTPAS
jgi:hypothetical protein